MTIILQIIIYMFYKLQKYRKQVALLIRIMPLVHKINDFALHGGTAINLFVKDMPRLSVDIDLTYLPLKNRDKSLQEINNNPLPLVCTSGKPFVVCNDCFPCKIHSVQKWLKNIPYSVCSMKKYIYCFVYKTKMNYICVVSRIEVIYE